jgi:zinc transporter ZupT|tara:strand:- start:300 stop:1451 length:1152 start_codon:yes stop_codon:yes gene_type:complete
VLPLVLLGGLLGLMLWSGPADALRGEEYPPVEDLVFQRVELGPDGIVATVFNDGPDAVTIAQVQVDDAFWGFSAESGTTLAHLGRTILTIPYPWVQGDTHVVRVVTSTGVTVDHEVTVAVETPRADARFLGIFALIGLYVGVIPVAIGLLWLPWVSRTGRNGLDFLLALTVGLLLFLLIEAGHDGLAAAALAPGSFQGVALFVFGALAAFVGLEMVGAWLRGRRASTGEPASRGWILAVMVATGIGLHNFGEGLAIGAAFSLGEASLGTVLIVGFTLHNTTEGLAIVAPLAHERVRLGQLVRLGLLGGGPTIVGAWIGGLVYSPIWSVLCLALGAGAIAQVIVQLSRQMVGTGSIARYVATPTVASGLFAGVAVMYVTGLIVG